MTPRRMRSAWLLLAALCLLPLTGGLAAAQDRPDPEARRDLAARLAASLDLTAEQARLAEEHLGAERAPGRLWSLAAALAPTLSDDQKAALLALPERPQDRAERPRQDGAGRPDGPGHAHRGRPARLDRSDGDRDERRAAMRAAMREAMRAALDLSPEQVQALEALRTQHREQAGARRAGRPAFGTIPAEVTEILTPAQEEVWQVHRGLMARLFHPHARPGHPQARPGGPGSRR